MHAIKFTLSLIFITLTGINHAFASHILAGGLTYTFLDSASGIYHYRITLTEYIDCLHGQAEAIAQDNPAFFTIYNNGSTTLFFVDTSVYNTSSTPVAVDYTTPCGSFSTLPTDVCALKRVFEKDFYLPASTMGYTVVYQRCCRSSSIVNLVDPGDNGITYFCTIPPVYTSNTSATFVKDPPLVVCISNTLVYDLSATDADGDSLSYELSPVWIGATDNYIKPVIASPPPFDTAHFLASSSYLNPMGGSSTISYDPVTGWITIAPDHLGIYVVGVSCHEWRHGVLVNTVTMEFNCLVVNCAASPSAYHPSAGADAVLLVGDSVHFTGANATVYNWSPATFLSNPSIAEPVGTFTLAGSFTYVLSGISDSGCTGTDTMTVTVVSHAEFRVPNAFTPNGDHINDVLVPIPLKTATLKGFKIFNRAGNLVYEGKNPREGWDGKYNGVSQDIGSYIWEVRYDDENGVERRQTGNVMLLK